MEVGNYLKIEQVLVQDSEVRAWIIQEEGPYPCYASCMVVGEGVIPKGWGANKLTTQAFNLCLHSGMLLLFLYQL